MAGHSKFKNIMHRKGAQDAKRGKMFTKIQREIGAAVKTGAPDPAMNPRLRTAIQWAREENMPKDKIDAAIKRYSGNTDSDNFESIRYEGYGPSGVAVIVLALSDNRNRTAPEMRSIFSKNGGNLGETGSVGFMFEQVGMLTYPLAKASEDAMLEAAIEAGADNCEQNETHHVITCSVENFGTVRDELEKKFGLPESGKLTFIAKTTAPVDETSAADLLKLVEALEDNDDVQEVFTNADIPEAVLTKLAS